ncbi:MAG TPA: AI-2E family transporter [Fimbriimonadaceae bacterium]|nr:AI-2E family transporter [Fimbriimonadaceae bacterium]
MVGWRVALWAVIVVAALAFLYQVRGILLPFIVALLISALLNPSIRKLRMRGYSRRGSVLVVCGLFFGALIAVGVWVTPIVSRQIITFKDKLDLLSQGILAENREDNFFLKWNPRHEATPRNTADQIDRFFEQNQALLGRVGLPTTRKQAEEEYVQPHKREIAEAAQAFFSGLLGFISGSGAQLLMTVLFGPFFAILILMDLDRFKRRSASWIPPSIRTDTIELISDIGNVFGKYLRGVMIVVLWYIALAALLLSLLGAPYAILLAILFALIYLIPYVGPVANALLLFTFTGLSGKTGNLFITFGSAWAFAAAITAVYFVVMVFFDPLVYTRIVGNSVGLHPVVSFFVVFSGAALFGPIGMILAFPVAGSVKVILDRLLRITSDGQVELDLPVLPMRHRSAV